MSSVIGYNARLFSGGLRSYLHLSRFRWLRRTLALLNCSCDSVLELGCFDGRAIDYLPRPPRAYYGFDANVEGGLDAAIAKWGNRYHFGQCWSATEMHIPARQRFDVAISLETLEHIPPTELSRYLAKIATHLRGYFLVTVPVEIGPVFMAKWLAKRAAGHDFGPERYSVAEWLAAGAGMSRRVARHHHKGFDYRHLVRQLAEHFEVVLIDGCPLGWLPPFLNLSVCITARTRIS